MKIIDSNTRTTVVKYDALSQSDSVDKMMADLQDKMASATDNMILQQLNEFVSRGLIAVETSNPVLIKSTRSEDIKVCQSVRLVLKDKEYIKRLEIQNEKLQEQLDKIKQMFKDLK